VNPPFVRLDLSIEHARAVGTLLDLATRIHMGQVSEILALVEAGTLPMRDDRAASCKRKATQEEQYEVDDAVVALRRALGHPSGSHFGIAHVSEEAKLGYEAMKAVKKALHDHLHPDMLHHVDGDGVRVRYGTGAVPAATMVTK